MVRLKVLLLFLLTLACDSSYKFHLTSASCLYQHGLAEKGPYIEMCIDFMDAVQDDEGDFKLHCEAGHKDENIKKGTWQEGIPCTTSGATASCIGSPLPLGGKKDLYGYDTPINAFIKNKLCSEGEYTELIAVKMLKASYTVWTDMEQTNKYQCIQLTEIHPDVKEELKKKFTSMSLKVAASFNGALPKWEDNGTCEPTAGVTFSCADAINIGEFKESTYWYTELSEPYQLKKKTECEGKEGTFNAH